MPRTRKGRSAPQLPIVKELFTHIDGSDLSDNAIEEKAGIAKSLISTWRHVGIAPHLVTLIAVAGVFGYELRLVKKDG